MMQTCAFLLLFPIGALIAGLRQWICDGWLKYHILFQILASVTVLTASSLQAYKTKKFTSKPLHIALGSFVTLLIIVQLLWAFFGRRIMDWTSWYTGHVILATLILTGGITNVYLGWSQSNASGVPRP